MDFDQPDPITLPETIDDVLRSEILKTHNVDDNAQKPIDDYVMAIPLTLRHAIGRLSQFQWFALEAGCTVDGFDHFLQITISQFGPNLLKLVWHLGNVIYRPKTWRNHLARQMMKLRPTELLTWLTQKPIAPGPMWLVSRLTDIPPNTQTLKHLINLLQNPEKLAKLKVAERLSHRLLKVFDGMPAWLMTPCIIAMVSRTKDIDAYEFFETLSVINTVVTQPSHIRPLVKYLESSHDGHSMFARLCKEMVSFNWGSDEPYLAPPERRRLPFPDPPFLEAGLLTAINSAGQLEDIGRQMRNCLGSYADNVRRGINYCYLYKGRPQIAVVLRRMKKSKKWGIEEMGAAHHKTISERTTKRVKAIFSEQLGSAFDPTWDVG